MFFQDATGAKSCTKVAKICSNFLCAPRAQHLAGRRHLGLVLKLCAHFGTFQNGVNSVERPLAACFQRVASNYSLATMRGHGNAPHFAPDWLARPAWPFFYFCFAITMVPAASSVSALTFTPSMCSFLAFCWHVGRPTARQVTLAPSSVRKKRTHP